MIYMDCNCVAYRRSIGGWTGSSGWEPFLDIVVLRRSEPPGAEEKRREKSLRGGQALGSET
jgi:hypothetical protein